LWIHKEPSYSSHDRGGLWRIEKWLWEMSRVWLDETRETGLSCSETGSYLAAEVI
jgi:hypothetical protein